MSNTRLTALALAAIVVVAAVAVGWTQWTQSSASDGVEPYSEIEIALMNKGFSEQDVKQAEMLVSRVFMYLDEIGQPDENESGDESGSATGADAIRALAGADRDGADVYQSLSDRIDFTAALGFAVRQSVDFGGQEAALNEYLAALQLDVEPSLYATDKDAYTNQKREKTRDLKDNIATITDIEQAAFERLRARNIGRMGGTSGAPGGETDIGALPGQPVIPDPARNARPIVPGQPPIQKDSDILPDAANNGLITP